MNAGAGPSQSRTTGAQGQNVQAFLFFVQRKSWGPSHLRQEADM